MKKIEVSTSLIPVFNVGMYETFIDPRYMLEGSLDELPIELQNEYWDLFDNAKYEKHVLDNARHFIESEILEQFTDLPFGIKKIEVEKIVSPKEYNFRTDELDFNLVVADTFKSLVIAWIVDNVGNEDFCKFLIEHYKSYDGFMSFTPCYPLALIEEIGKDTERCVSAVIHFLISEFKEDNQRDFEELVNQDIWYTEFLIDGQKSGKFYEKVELIVNEQN